MDITIIEWEDSFNPLSGWQHPNDFEPSRTVCLSVGIVIHETETTIFIAGSYAKETANTVEQVNGVMSIPKGCVIKRETVYYDMDADKVDEKKWEFNSEIFGHSAFGPYTKMVIRDTTI